MTENGNKQPYLSAELELLRFASADIITSSGIGGDWNAPLGGSSDSNYDGDGWT